MALGNLTTVDNIDRKFGADASYLFVKLQDSRGVEEYFLLTEEENVRLAQRAAKNPEDLPSSRKGILTIVANRQKQASANSSYYHLRVRSGSDTLHWLLTDFDLERIRQRVEANSEDIEANRESWLADLFD